MVFIIVHDRICIHVCQGTEVRPCTVVTTIVHRRPLLHAKTLVSFVSWFYQDEDIRRRRQLWLVTASEYRQHSGRRHWWWYAGRGRLHRREATTCEGPGEIPSEQTLEVDQSPSRYSMSCEIWLTAKLYQYKLLICYICRQNVSKPRTVVSEDEI